MAETLGNGLLGGSEGYLADEQNAHRREDASDSFRCEFGSFHFTKDEAASNFKELAERYFNRNFCTLPKAEIDLMMFEFLLDAYVPNGFPALGKGEKGDVENGLGPRRNAPSTLTLAMQLGITPARVEGYLERHALKSEPPSKGCWWESLETALCKCNYLVEGEKAYFTLPDRYTRHVLTEALNSGGYYYDFSFNAKNLIVPCSTLVALAVNLYVCQNEDDEEKLSQVKEVLRGQAEKVGGSAGEDAEKRLRLIFEEGAPIEGWGSDRFMAVGDVVFSLAGAAETALNLTGLLSSGGAITSTLEKMFKAISDNVRLKKEKKGR